MDDGQNHYQQPASHPSESIKPIARGVEGAPFTLKLQGLVKFGVREVELKLADD